MGVLVIRFGYRMFCEVKSKIKMVKRILKLLSKNYVLFTLGALGCLISGVWFLHEYDFEPLYTFLGSISALLGDFLLEKENKEQHRQLLLDKLSKIELQELVFGKNKINNNLLKKDLISKIIENEKISLYKWSRFKTITLITVIIAIPLTNKFFPPIKEITPVYSIAFYENKKNVLTLIRPDSLKFDVNSEDMLLDRVRLPLRIAVRNEEKKPLKVVKIVITYPANIEVTSLGNPIIDPTSRTIIYEHNIETLEPTNNFTPLKTIDTLIIPFKFRLIEGVAMMKNNFPVYSSIIVDEALWRDFTFSYKIDIYCENRPVVSGFLSSKINSNLKLILDIPEGEKVQVTNSDKDVFNTPPSKLKVIANWSETYKKTMQKIDYYKIQSNSIIYQYVYVDKILRRVTAKNKNNDFINFVLINDDTDEEIDYKILGDKKSFMIDWKREEVN